MVKAELAEAPTELPSFGRYELSRYMFDLNVPLAPYTSDRNDIFTAEQLLRKSAHNEVTLITLISIYICVYINVYV